MITPALIAEEVKTSSYRRVARARGLTVGQVAGLVRRHRKPWVRRQHPGGSPPRAESRYEGLIIDLMLDGEVRSTPEIVVAVGASGQWCRALLARLEAAGCLVRLREWRNGSHAPCLWREAPE